MLTVCELCNICLHPQVFVWSGGQSFSLGDQVNHAEVRERLQVPSGRKQRKENGSAGEKGSPILLFV